MIPIRQMPCENGLTVGQVLDRKPWLHLFSNWNHMEQRVREYDPCYFLVHNVLRDRIELHCTENKTDTYSFVVSQVELNSGKLVDHIRMTDQKTRGIHTIYDEMALQNEKYEAAKARELRNTCETAAREMQPLMKKAFWV